MSESSNSKSNAKVETPKSLFVLIIVILGAMYYYAAFVDVPNANNPEDTVNGFYQAYFDHNYNAVSAETSVFWATQYLPQYQSLEPAQMLSDRIQIEHEFADVLSSLSVNQPTPSDLTIEILSQHTKLLSHSALVAYNFIQSGEPVGMEMALLIKEDNGFKVFNVNPTNEEIMLSVTDNDMEIINNNFKALLGIE